MVSMLKRSLAGRSVVNEFCVVVLLMLCCAQIAYAERKTTYFHTDAFGSVVAASGESGALLWRKEYAPFGDQLDSTAGNEKVGYTGKEHDEVTGLTYFGARYYDPHLGRFVSVDPVGFNESNPMSFNRYAYANNNPYKYVDPDGREVRLATHAVGAFQHAKIVIIPDNQKKWEKHPLFQNRINGRAYATLGAGQPTDNASYGLFGHPLIGAPNRKTDLNISANTTDQLLKLPDGKSEDEVIAELFERDAAYGDNVDYSLFPSSLADGYNSNSYALGLLLATGFRDLKVPPGTAGYRKPLEAPHFERRGAAR